MLERLNRYYPVRYTAVLLSVFFSIIFAVVWLATGSGGFMLLVFGALAVLGIHDMRLYWDAFASCWRRFDPSCVNTF